MRRLLTNLLIILVLGLTFNIHASYAQIVESDDNLDKLRRVIINDPKFFEKSKYFSKILQGINPKTGNKIETSVVAVYLNYDEILETITKNPEINSIGNFAWGFEFSKKNLNGLTAKFTGRKAIDACYKDAKKKKLSDGECIFVDFQNNLGDWANSHRGQNYLYKERQKRKILASGKIDESDEMLNKLYKVIMNDPDFIKKAEEGRSDEINTCIACNQACLDHVFERKIASCLVNPQACHETELVYSPVKNKKKIAVVGAGPAGMSFSCVAAERGHEVTMFDGASEIGGQFNIAKQIPGKEEFHETLRYFSKRIQKANVNVKLNTTVDVNDLKDFDDAKLLPSSIELESLI